MKLDDRNGNRLVGALQVTLEDEVMLITDQGNIIRTFVDQIRETGRLSKGVRIIRLANDAKLITLERIAREALDDKDEVISSEDAAETEAGTVTDVKTECSEVCAVPAEKSPKNNISLRIRDPECLFK